MESRKDTFDVRHLVVVVVVILERLLRLRVRGWES